MRKIGKSALALFMAGVMALMPGMNGLAAENVGSDSDNSIVVEEEISDEIEEETGNESKEETGDVTEEASGETEEDGGVAEEETGDEIEEETGDEVEAETGDDTEEVGDEIEEETGDEVEAETSDVVEETEEEVFPGLENTVLSSAQLEDRAELLSHISEIDNYVEGVDYIAGELVFLSDTEEEAEEIAAAYGGELKSYGYRVGVVQLPEKVSVVEAIYAAAISSTVVLPPAWPNYIYHTCTDEVDFEEAGAEELAADEVYMDEAVYEQATSDYNDPLLKPTATNYQWQHAMVGSATAWNADYTGNGIKIAILDTGVNTSSELNVIDNKDFSGSSSASDVDGHGTHVAGLAAAKLNNGTLGAGIAPDAQILNIKVLGDNGQGGSDGILRGINYAVENGADIINMSLGGYQYTTLYKNTVLGAYNSGVAVFAAAGNEGSKSKSYPASLTGAYAIGAVYQNKGRTYFSNYGSWVKFSAPGYELPSLPKSGSTPEIMSGTSQATPVISGTAAVILSADESIRNKTGKDRVNALISKMNKGKIAGSGGAASIVSLPKALGIPVSTAAPSVPVFGTKSGTTFETTTTGITITAKSKADTIYYSTDGKAPTYKNGVLSANATKSSGVITIGGSAKVTVQAIAVNSCGVVSKAAKATYNFKPPVSSIAISGQSVLLKGKSTTLKATASPDYAKNKSVTWTSSAPDAVSVSSSGKVTATNKAVNGTVYIITAEAKDGSGAKGTFNITVKDTATVKTVSFSKKSDTIIRGGSNATYNVGELLTVTTLDGSSVTANDVIWSSNKTNIATVNAAGVVTAIAPGKAVIKAVANDGSGKSASFTLTVKQQITKIAITGLTKLSNGKSSKLAITFNDGVKSLAPSSKAVTWAVTPAAAGVTVDKNGTVKAAKTAKEGPYTVTATANDSSEEGTLRVSGSTVIEVSNNPISKISLNKTKATIFRTAGNYGAPTQVTLVVDITAKTADGKANASSAAYEFTSSNPGIATVTQAGVVKATGNAAGTTTITCKATDGSGKKATCKVTVANPASKITVVPTAGIGIVTYQMDDTGNDLRTMANVGKNKKIKLSAAFEEDFGTVSNKKVTWTSADESVAKVDKNGNVTGLKIGGYTTITATVNDESRLSSSFMVMVVKPITKLGVGNSFIEFNPSRTFLDLEGLEGNEFGWVYIYYNGDTTYNSYDNYVCPCVTIEVSNPDIVTIRRAQLGVNQFGMYPTKNGKTKVTIKAMDGSGTKVTYEVRVSGYVAE